LNGLVFDGTLAQLVEQRTFNPFVVGSTPARPTILSTEHRFRRFAQVDIPLALTEVFWRF
jgi:hypothetical protein